MCSFDQRQRVNQEAFHRWLVASPNDCLTITPNNILIAYWNKVQNCFFIQEQFYCRTSDTIASFIAVRKNTKNSSDIWLWWDGTMVTISQINYENFIRPKLKLSLFKEIGVERICNYKWKYRCETWFCWYFLYYQYYSLKQIQL